MWKPYANKTHKKMDFSLSLMVYDPFKANIKDDMKGIISTNGTNLITGPPPLNKPIKGLLGNCWEDYFYQSLHRRTEK